MDKDPDYWFPAKQYGWGWGPPVKWQGWVVTAVFVAAVAIGGFLFPPSQNLPAFIAVIVLASLAFGLVCWWKGEPARWRWGKD